MKAFEIGIDIGGTFTDFVVVDVATGQISVGKHLTTAEPSQGVIEGVTKLLTSLDKSLADARRLVHGTTLATNTIITRRGSKTGLLTTAGFRDSIEIGHGERYDIYDLFIRYPEPLVPRDLRLEVKERLLKDGSVRLPLDEESLRQALENLLDAGVESVAISFVHSYANPEHEERARELVQRLAPHVDVDVSSDVCPEAGEFIRTSTTVVNAYVKRRMREYLTRLETRLAEDGFRGSYNMMMSNGGSCSFDFARTYPVRLIESGPAGGALAAAYIGQVMGKSNIIAFDMGGTTAKCTLIRDGRPQVNYDYFEVDRIHRFGRGSGIPIRTPSIDLIEIGAGGGSLAHIDPLGLLKVGPESAESNPGPACYNLGGTLPTVTDSNLILGYLNPDYFLGGEMQLQVPLAARAIQQHVAEPLGVSLTRAAWGVHEVVNENMAAAARSYLLEKGEDPRQYSLLAFGGAGPLHACRLAENLRMTEVICPPGAGVASALGLLIAPLTMDMTSGAVGELANTNWERIQAMYEEFEREALAQLQSAHVPDDAVVIQRFLDLRYAGQGYNVTIVLPDGPLGPHMVAEIENRFENEYRRLYGRIPSGAAVETVAWRGTVSGAGRLLQFPEIPAGEGARNALKGTRPAFFPEFGEYRETAVYDRYALGAGDRFEGPAIVEERESTVILIPGWHGTVDTFGNLVLRKNEANVKQ